MLSEEFCNRLGARPAPIPLQFADVGNRGERAGSGLDHALDSALVAFFSATRSIRDEIDLVIRCQCRKDGHAQAHFGPEARHDQLLLTGFINPLKNAGIVPGIKACAVNRYLVRMHRLQFLEQSLPFGKSGGEQCWHFKYLGRLGKEYCVVDHYLVGMGAQC
ncbi:hypothetical protein D3C72_1661100 [compost metagenome]